MSDPYVLIECRVLVRSQLGTPLPFVRHFSSKTLWVHLSEQVTSKTACPPAHTQILVWWPIMTAAGKVWDLSNVRIASLGSFPDDPDDLTAVSQCMEPIKGSAPELHVPSDFSNSTTSWALVHFPFMYASLLWSCWNKTWKSASLTHTQVLFLCWTAHIMTLEQFL